jgi:hypothetical protein
MTDDARGHIESDALLPAVSNSAEFEDAQNRTSVVQKSGFRPSAEHAIFLEMLT